MKKILFILGFLFVLAFSIQAQNYKGYYIDAKRAVVVAGDTMRSTTKLSLTDTIIATKEFVEPAYILTYKVGDSIYFVSLSGDTLAIKDNNDFTPKYGALYNHYVTTDARKITSSDDWAVPTITQWTTLNDYVSNSGQFKETGYIYWFSPNVNAENAYGLSIRGGGYRSYLGVFTGINITGQMWSSTIVGGTTAYKMDYRYNIDASYSNTFLRSGNLVRFVKDATGVADGELILYTGNDGYVYLAVCIDELYWLTSNLVETKYRNGDYITGFNAGVYTPISNATWAALTTEAMCYYNDDNIGRSTEEQISAIVLDTMISHNERLVILERSKGNANMFLEGKITGRTIDITYPYYTPDNGYMIHVIPDGDIATSADSISLSINGLNPLQIYNYYTHDKDYALELVYYENRWFNLMGKGEGAFVKNTNTGDQNLQGIRDTLLILLGSSSATNLTVSASSTAVTLNSDTGTDVTMFAGTNMTFTPIGLYSFYINASSTGSGMVYPGAGIPLSTGSAWGTSITNNSNDWNTAYTNRIVSLTVIGSSGAATLASNILNIPTYTLAGLGGIDLTALSSTATGLAYNNLTGVISFTSGYSIPTNTKQTEWDTGYTDRFKWNGESDGLTPATGRTSLGGTTIGQNVFTSANPGAITFLRGNANNTVSWLSAADFRVAIGAGTGSSYTGSNGILLTGTNFTFDLNGLSLMSGASILDSDFFTVHDASVGANYKVLMSGLKTYIGSGIGNVVKVGTPVNNQVTVWTGDGTAEGSPNLTFDDTNLTVTGHVVSDESRVQSLNTNSSTVTLNALSGFNANITVTTNTSFTLTMSNLTAGTSGTIVITNTTAGGAITLAGYTHKVSPARYVGPNIITTSGSSKIDSYSWYYNGNIVIWNGDKDYK